MAGPEFAERGVLLALRFEPTSRDDPRADEIASVLDDLEGLYRVVPAAAALGVPVAELLAAYKVARAESAAARLTADWFAIPNWLPLPDLEEFLYFMRRARPRGRASAYAPAALLPPGNPMRVRRLSMGSPLEYLALIPSEYWTGGGFLLFLKAVEAYFNMPERIRTERIDLRAKQAERRADEREAELREERAVRELEGLRREDAPLRLVEGEVRPENDDE